MRLYFILFTGAFDRQQCLEGLCLRCKHKLRVRGVRDGGESSATAGFQPTETQRDDQQRHKHERHR